MTALCWKIKWLHQQSNLTVCLKYKNVSNRNMCGVDDKQSFRLSSRQQSFNVAFDHLENHQLQSKSQMDNYNEYTGWKCQLFCVKEWLTYIDQSFDDSKTIFE